MSLETAVCMIAFPHKNHQCNYLWFQYIILNEHTTDNLYFFLGISDGPKDPCRLEHLCVHRQPPTILIGVLQFPCSTIMWNKHQMWLKLSKLKYPYSNKMEFWKGIKNLHIMSARIPIIQFCKWNWSACLYEKESIHAGEVKISSDRSNSVSRLCSQGTRWYSSWDTVDGLPAASISIASTATTDEAVPTEVNPGNLMAMEISNLTFCDHCKT